MIDSNKSYQQQTYEIIFTYNDKYINIHQYLMMSIYLSGKDKKLS